MLFLTHIRRNWHAGLTVALISIPLSISFAIASHATPLMGIVTAIWAGIIAAIFGGTNYNIVGPTGALSESVAAVAIVYGIHALPTLAILSGLLIALAYYLRLDRFIAFVLKGVVHGFTLGVALIIGLGQINFALGLHIPTQKYFFDGLLASLNHIPDLSLAALLTTCIFLGLIFFLWLRLPQLPPLAVIMPIGLFFGLVVTKIDPDILETIGMRFGELKASLFIMPKFYFDYHMLLPAIGITLIAILETLISAKLADQITKTTHDPHKELIGLSLANIAAGLSGGFPATATLSRTSLNIKSGAVNRMAGVISGLGIAVISIIFLPWFSYIPLPVIAAMLIFLSIQMVEHQHFSHMWHNERSQFWLALFVAAVCIGEDPVIGILLGTAIALAMEWKKKN